MPPGDIIDRLTSALADAPADVIAAYLFGSVARGTATPSSDVDLGILLRERPPATLAGRRLEYEDVLAQKLGARVQIVILNDAPPDLVHRVLAARRLILERDRALRIRFEVRARNQYFDLQPILARYRAAALRKAAASVTR
jgi:predicted nucleotidyltransferase